MGYVFRKLPLGAAMAVGQALGWFWYYVIPIRRKVAIANVKRALKLPDSECRRIVRRCFAHQTMMAVESLRMLDLTQERARELVERRDFDILFDAMDGGKGVVVVMAHMGNYEMLAATQAMLGIPLHAVVREFRNQAVNDYVARVRDLTGYKTISPKRSKDQLRGILAKGEIVCLLVDQHMPAHRGVVCSFFGQLASTSPAPARFAMEAGAPLLPVVTFRDPTRPGHHVVRIEPPIELETPFDDPEKNLWHNTQRINHHIEGWIREHPEQWLWMHKRWKVHDDPDGWDIKPELRRELLDKKPTNSEVDRPLREG